MVRLHDGGASPTGTVVSGSRIAPGTTVLTSLEHSKTRARSTSRLYAFRWIRDGGQDPRTSADWFSALTDTPARESPLQSQAPKHDPAHETPNFSQHSPRANACFHKRRIAAGQRVTLEMPETR